jgi:hypothetical protein
MYSFPSLIRVCVLSFYSFSLVSADFSLFVTADVVYVFLYECFWFDALAYVPSFDFYFDLSNSLSEKGLLLWRSGHMGILSG